MSRWRWAATAGLMAAVLTLATLLACGGSSSSSTTTTTPTLKTITVTPASANVNINGSTNFIATALDSSGNAVSNLSYTWNSSDQSVASISGNGLATGLKAGATQITASVTTVAATATTPATVVTSNTATLNVIPAVAKVTVSPVNAQIAVGKTQKFTAQVLDANGNPIPTVIVTWQVSDPSVVSISASDQTSITVTGNKAGTVAITAQGNGVQSAPAQLTVTP
jgi:uncharacterized protein YjdB